MTGPLDAFEYLLPRYLGRLASSVFVGMVGGFFVGVWSKQFLYYCEPKFRDIQQTRKPSHSETPDIRESPLNEALD